MGKSKASGIMSDPLLQQEELAEVLREWNDEEDEVVEFIQHSRRDNGDDTRHRTENGSPLQEIEISGERVHNHRERSTLTGKPFYTPYIRCLKTTCLFISFLGLVRFLRVRPALIYVYFFSYKIDL